MFLQILLPPESLIVILQVYLLRESIMIPQVSLPPEGPVTIPLIHPKLGELLTPQTQSTPGGPGMTPLIWHLMLLIYRPELKVVKLQKELPARLLHSRRGQNPLIHHSQRISNMSVTPTSLLHEKSKQKPIMEIRSHLILKVTTRKPLIQIFLLHGINEVQGARILIQICHLHGID